MLKRKVDLFLKEWRENINRKPLIISGARQIGKTTSIREFGKTYKSCHNIKQFLIMVMKLKISSKKWVYSTQSLIL